MERSPRLVRTTATLMSRAAALHTASPPSRPVTRGVSATDSTTSDSAASTSGPPPTDPVTHVRRGRRQPVWFVHDLETGRRRGGGLSPAVVVSCSILTRDIVGAGLVPARGGFVLHFDTGGAGWPRVVAHPRLPQIRTCPTRASGSSKRGIATRIRAHPRAAISDRSPLPAALSLRRWSGTVAGASVRTAVHDPIRRFPPPGPLGRVPRLRRYYQRTPTSRRPSRRTSFSFVWRYHSVARFAPAARAVLAGQGAFLSRPPMPRTPVETSRPPRALGPGSWATRACMPRSPTPAEPNAPDRVAQTNSARRWCLPLLSQRRLPRCIRISWLNHAACRLPVYASQTASPLPTQHSVPAGWSTLAGQDSHLLGRTEGFRHFMQLPPSPSFA